MNECSYFQINLNNSSQNQGQKGNNKSTNNIDGDQLKNDQINSLANQNSTKSKKGKNQVISFINKEQKTDILSCYDSCSVIFDDLVSQQIYKCLYQCISDISVDLQQQKEEQSLFHQYLEKQNSVQNSKFQQINGKQSIQQIEISLND
ncbi:hypothetical protein PPERSA_07527 [Pseudocohnilembus persalinus]|uniref:Tim10/DDP family zinc finger n=1 Tax=Pseudocohnilembus persalinus TaxID=266149 RepID=A0A0V0QZX5_PSEPJ|nr:hypothetical protein PPERSA_07527 [Pseudocohnilembus persalinus]|eukprot:KRX07777.1 hypothetical protein PPERSA_07527 [Pseudocohnilembus persalinus]